MNKEDILKKSRREYSKTKQDERVLSETNRAWRIAVIASFMFVAVLLILTLIAENLTGNSYSTVFYTVSSMFCLIMFINELCLYIRLRNKSMLMSPVLWGLIFTYWFLRLILKMFEIL